MKILVNCKEYDIISFNFCCKFEFKNWHNLCLIVINTDKMSDVNINFQNFNDGDNLSKDQFYTQFKARLDDTTSFPTDYTYKFIYPSSEETMVKIKDIFTNANPKFDYKASKNRKYTSITVQIYALDSDQVIDFYQQVAQIKDVIML